MIIPQTPTPAIQKFYFESMSESGKQVTGYIFAENQTIAREKLNDNGMVVMTLQLYKEKPLPDGVKKYEFEAMDKNGKMFHGEIESEDDYQAYKKLVSDYKFTVNFIVNTSWDDAKKEEWKKKGVNPSWAIQVQEEKSKEKDTPSFASVVQHEDDDQNKKIQTILQEKQERMEFLQKQIDEIIAKVQLLIKKHEQILQPEKRRYIQGTLDRMSRLKRSNSVEHLKNIMLELFELLSSDDIFVNLQGEMLEEMDAIKGEFKTFSLGFSNKINRGLSSIKIDTKEIQETFSKLMNMSHVFDEVLSIFLWLCIGGVGGSFLFLVGQYIRSLVIGDSTIILFYLSSWFIWFFVWVSSLLGTGLWAERKYGLSLPLSQNLLAVFVGLILFIVALIQFPVLFFWVRF